MKRTFPYLLLLIGLLGWSACLDEIEIDPLQRPETGYVVQGRLVVGNPAFAEVKVERLFVYTSNINQAVTDAEVRLLSEAGDTYTFTGNPLDGVHRTNLLPEEFAVQPGERYRVEVRLNDGAEIISNWDQIAEAPPLGNLSWRFDEIETESEDGLVSRIPAVAYAIDAPLRTAGGQKARLRWEFIDAYRITDNLDFVCYVENPYQAGRVYLADGAAIGGDNLVQFPLFKDIIGRKLSEGYYLTAYQQSLSPGSFDYWEEVALLLEREGTIFDNPAGRIRTNMRHPADSTALVYGYFSAFQQDTIRLYISREAMGERPFYCPRPSNGQPFPPVTICDNCIAAQGAAYEKPFYWEE